MPSNAVKRAASLGLCVAAGAALLWALAGGGAVPPLGAVLSGFERASIAPEPMAAVAEPPAPAGPAACAAATAPAAPRPLARVHVTVRLPDGARTTALAVPELLRLDDRGGSTPVAAHDSPPEPGPLALASQPPVERAGDAAAASRTFEVTPGRYAAAWHLWLPVPGTSTWRIQRGRGPEIVLSPGEAEREVVVCIGEAELTLDASLEKRAPGARYHFTAKDGD